MYIYIETSNSAFEDENKGPEIARILEEIAEKFAAGTASMPAGADTPAVVGAPFRDINGNKVGFFCEERPADAVADESFSLEIATSNEAFANGNFNYEVEKILRHAAIRAQDGILDMQLRDTNGNVVGAAVISQADEKTLPIDDSQDA
jgi:hypothetical protein